MRYKILAAVASLWIVLASLSAPAGAEYMDSHPPQNTASLTGTGNTSQGTGKTDSQGALSLLDAVWILGFSVAGLVLLRKVQGE